MQREQQASGDTARDASSRREVLRGEVVFASTEEQSQRSAELLGAGALLVTFPPPTREARGHLGQMLDELVERELARMGAPSPYLSAWAAMPDDVQARLADQLFRARTVGAAGLAIAMGSLRAVAAPALTPDDSTALRSLAAMTEDAPLVLLVDDADMQLVGYGAPVPLTTLLARRPTVIRPSWPPQPDTRPTEPEIELSGDDATTNDTRVEIIDDSTHSSVASLGDSTHSSVASLDDSSKIDEATLQVEPVREGVPAVAEPVRAAPARRRGASGMSKPDSVRTADEPSAPVASAVVGSIETSVPGSERVTTVATTVARSERIATRAAGAKSERVTTIATAVASTERIAPVDPIAPPQPLATGEPVMPPQRQDPEPRTRTRGAPRSATAGVPVSGPNDAWRSWAIALSSAKGAQPLAAFERLFAESYVPLSNAIAAGLDDPRALRAYDEFRRSFERSYTDTFATFGATNRRPRLVMDAYDIASKQARLSNARSAHILVVDSMRFDLGCMVRDALGRETTGLATLTSEVLLWSALPTTTMRQLETLARGLDALRAPAREEASESLRGRAAEVVRRLRVGSRELYKLDLVPAMLEVKAHDIVESLPEVAEAAAQAIARHISTLQPRTLLFVVGDHGFIVDRRGQLQTGGSSPEEVLVPAFSWLIGELH